jgi:hypothetical protein
MNLEYPVLKGGRILLNINEITKYRINRGYLSMTGIDNASNFKLF